MESKPKKELIRVTARDDEVKPDPTGKADGRGVYLCRNAECFMKAKKRRSIGRSLKIELTEAQLGQLLKELEEVFDIEH
jgi:predicted RNA-binding protein YlxR (DUF448 family)